MKRSFIKVVSSFAIVGMISTSFTTAAFANSTTQKSNEPNQNEIYQNDIPKDSREAGIQNTPLAKSQPLTVLPKKEKYSFRDLNQMSSKEILDLTCEIGWEDISDLFKYNSESYAFYSNKSRVQDLINGLYEKGQAYTPNDDKGIDTLVEILRSGFYLGYYNDSLKYINDRKFQDKCIPAMLAIQNNKNFKLGEKGQDIVVNALGKLIGNASCNEKVVNNMAPILDQYYTNMDTFIDDKLKGDAIYSIIKETAYDIDQYKFENNISDGANTPWTGKIDSFINSLSKFMNIAKITDQNGWIVNNSIYYTGKLAKLHTDPSIPHKEIYNKLESLPKYSEQYFKAVDSLISDFNSKDPKGNAIDTSKIIEDGKKYYLPKTYTFDDGKMIIKAGDKVSESKIQRLYWASKEVKSQFHRVIGNDKPLEKGNADDVLTMVIYNSPKEYKLNRVLYGYSVDNGGMYIEGDGTFFTYERTPQESIYSLEELFRHEFTHYLQGRYLVPGLFNRGDFYKGNNSRITWFEEGSAEFFAGSTRTSVLPRKSMVGGISQNSSTRFDTYKLLHSKYDDGWDFYTYGYAFSDYMYNKNKTLFKDLVTSMKNNDVKGYEAIIDRTGRDFAINKDYKDHMQKLVDNYDNYDIPLVSDDYMKKYENKSINEIQSDIEKNMGLKESKIKKESSDYFDTYILESTYTLNSNKGEVENFNDMNTKINEALDKLGKLNWGGYKTVTAYFANPRVNSYNQVEYDIVFKGLLSHNKNFNGQPIVKLECPKAGDTGEEIKFSSEGSTDDSKIVDYSWDFGDDTTSTEKNPTHVYKKAGNYTVTLTVTDDQGLSSKEFKQINISKTLKGDVVLEKEENDQFENANPVYLNNLVKGSMLESDNKDIYSFNVTKPGDVEITLVKENEDEDCNWLLYDEKNTKDYIDFPETIGNQLSKTVKIDKPGKYYLVVYKTKSNVDYKFTIEGAISASDDGKENPDKEPKYIYEKEDNETFEKANRVSKNQSVLASLEGNDNRDTYYVDVLSKGTVNVIVENTNGSNKGLNWVAYSSENVNDYIGYPTKVEGNKISGTFTADKPGRYYIVAYKNTMDKKEYKLDIEGDIDKAYTNEEVTEKENNDSFQNANEIRLDTPLIGSLDDKDTKDIYSFEVNETKELDIKLNNLNNLGLTWTLYKDSDLNNYIGYGAQSGSLISNKIKVTPGKYYLYVYKYNQGNGSYSVVVK
jgi:microbial collagenase